MKVTRLSAIFSIITALTLAISVPHVHADGLLYVVPFEIGLAAYSHDTVCQICHTWPTMGDTGFGYTHLFYTDWGLSSGSEPDGSNYPYLQITHVKLFYADKSDYIYFYIHYMRDVHVHIAQCSSAWMDGIYTVYFTNPDGSKVNYIPPTRFEHIGGSIDCISGSPADLTYNDIQIVSYPTTMFSALNSGYYYTFEYDWIITANPGSYIVTQNPSCDYGASIDQGGYNSAAWSCIGSAYDNCLVVSWASSPVNWCTPAPP